MNILIYYALFIVVNAIPEQLPLNINGLHLKQQQNIYVDPYLHTDLFFNAIHNGNSEFKLTYKQNNININENYANLSRQSIQETITTTTLFSNVKYHSLDIENEIFAHPNHVIDCTNDRNVNVNDYYVGSSKSKNPTAFQYANHNSKAGFIFSRQVTKTLQAIIKSKECVYAETKLVHPIELMDTHIQSTIQFPYDRIIIPNDNNAERNLRGDPMATVDPPMLLCTNEKFTKNTGLVHKSGKNTISKYGIPINYEYSFDTNGNECLYADATVPGSINFNHAEGLNAIKPTINLAQGVVCNNCYSFIGASILVDINIFGGNTKTFTFEAKDVGGAGFNLDISITNPSFSASKYINLAGPGQTYSIPIVAGLSLDLGFGGAWATIKGSGSAKGQAKFSSGYTLYEDDHVMYANSRWTAKHTLTQSNQLKPRYSINGFKLSTTQLTAIVSLSARIKYSFGGSIPIVDIGASIDFSTVLTAVIQYYKKGNYDSYTMGFNAENRRLFSENIFYPGDQIHFIIDYHGFNPNENHELYLTHHHSNEMPSYKSSVSYGTGTPITKHIFKSSHSGKGSQTISWTVPHDSNLMQKNNDGVYFSVHSNARINRYYSNKFHLSQNRDRTKSSVVEYPSSGVSVPIHLPIIIKWHNESMKYFRNIPGTDGMGADKVSSNISIIIIAYNKNRSSNAYELVNNIVNVGAYKVSLPSWLRSVGEEFTIAIHDSKEYTKIAWHHGKFKLAPRSNQYERRDNSKLEPVNVSPPMLENGLYLWGDYMVSNKQMTSKQSSRDLAGQTVCPNSAISIMLQIEFGFDGFTVLGKQMAVGSARSNPFIVIPQTNFCI